MPRRTIFHKDGNNYIVLPYTGFQNFGVYTDPSPPLVVVPLFENVQEALVPASHYAASYEENLRLQGIAGVSSLIRNRAQPPGDRILTYEDKIAFPFLFFRGESREEYGIMPTLYRNRTNQDLTSIVYRRLKAEGRAARLMQTTLMLRHHRKLSFEQGRAAARHYGVQSALTDFTFDPRVAACFAQTPFRDFEKEQTSSKPVGLIYCLSYDMLQRVFPTQGWKTLDQGGLEIDFYSLGGSFHIPYLGFDPETERLTEHVAEIAVPEFVRNKGIKFRGVPVPGVKRIVLQQGIFIEIEVEDPLDWITPMFFWYLLDFVSEKWAFFRTDSAYADPAGEITFAKLLPTDSFAVRLASWLIKKLMSD